MNPKPKHSNYDNPLMFSQDQMTILTYVSTGTECFYYVLAMHTSVEIGSVKSIMQGFISDKIDEAAKVRKV